MPNPKLPDERSPDDRTLRDIVEAHLALYFECDKCWRLSLSDLLNLVWRFGPDTKVQVVKNKVVCSRCGAKRAIPLLRRGYRKHEMGWTPRPPRASR